MSYDGDETIKELNFKIDDDGDEEPLEPLEESDDLKFSEDEEEDPENRYH